MNILEQKIEGKKEDPSLCEDCLTVTPDFIAVIDGVTSKSPMKPDGCTTGRLAALSIEAVIASWPPDIALDDALESMTIAIRRVYETHHILEDAAQTATHRLAASVILYSRHHHEIWSIGDCQCMINKKWHTYPKLIDDIIAAARALYLETEILAGKSEEALLLHDTSRDYVLPLIKAAANFENLISPSPYAFGVVDGFPINPISVHVEKVIPGDQVVLASDGYPQLFSSLEESEAYLTHLLKTDPLCFRSYLCTKGLIGGNRSFDDRTYIHFEA